MFEVEIKIKRTDENGIYYEVVPIGEYADKLIHCVTKELTAIESEVLTEAKQILNRHALQVN